MIKGHVPPCLPLAGGSTFTQQPCLPFSSSQYIVLSISLSHLLSESNWAYALYRWSVLANSRHALPPPPLRTLLKVLSTAAAAATGRGKRREHECGRWRTMLQKCKFGRGCSRVEDQSWIDRAQNRKRLTLKGKEGRNGHGQSDADGGRGGRRGSEANLSFLPPFVSGAGVACGMALAWRPALATPLEFE